MGWKVFHSAAVLIVLSMAGTSGAEELQAVNVQLKWYHQSQFAGLYMAREEGYYRSRGLEVKFIEGGPEIDWQSRMADGSKPFGIASANELVLAKLQGIPVIAIAAVMQVSPQVWFTLAGSGITDPRQFAGRKVATGKGGKVNLLWVAKNVGIPFDSIEPVPLLWDLAPFYSGEVDIMTGYNTNVVPRIKKEGHDINIIHPLDYGVQIYDDIIYVHERFMERSPETVLDFLRASLRGWEKAIKDPGFAVRHTLLYAKDADSFSQYEMLLKTIPYVHTGEAPIGWMENSIWADIVFFTGELEGVKVDPDEPMFTNRFLKEIYGEAP